MDTHSSTTRKINIIGAFFIIICIGGAGLFIPALASIQASSDAAVYGISPMTKIRMNAAPDGSWSPGSFSIKAAKNEYEPFQIWLDAASMSDPEELGLEISDLAGKEGAILSENITAHIVKYVNLGVDPVTGVAPTGKDDYWPDPLWPITLTKGVGKSTGTFTLNEDDNNKNNLLWMTVYVPKDATAGSYTGGIKFYIGRELVSTFNVNLEVYNFALPDEPSLGSLFGSNPETFSKWHSAKTDYDKEAVLRLYLEDYSKHRLSPFLYPVQTPDRFLPNSQVTWDFLNLKNLQTNIL